MPIRLKILAACLLLTMVSLGLGIYSLRSQQKLGDIAVRTYDEALVPVSFIRSATTKFVIVEGIYALAQRDLEADPDTADRHPFDESAAEEAFDTVLDELDVVIERAAAGRPRSIAVELRDTVKKIKKGAADVLMTTVRLNQERHAFDAAVELFSQDGFDYRTRAQEVVASSIRSTLIALGVAIAVALAITFALSAAIVPSLRRATVVASAIADGRLDNVIPIRRRGRSETTTLLRALSRMQDAIRDQIVRIKTLHDEEEAQRHLVDAERRHNEAAQAAAAAAQSTVVTGLAAGLERLAKGDLTFRLHERFTEDYEQLRTNFNAAVAELEQMVQGIASNAAALRGNSGEIAQAADDLSRRSEQQAASLEQTAAAVHEITATVRKTAEGAKHATNIVAQTRADAEVSDGVVNRAAAAMGNIEQSSQKISQIIGVIDEIAFQTNLLALNAGVEAARAGETGRGFAVVASEVRALAQRSAQAAKEIKGLISTSTATVNEGVKLVHDTASALRRMVAQVNEINAVVVNIAASNREQAMGLNEVNTAIAQMDQMTQQNAAMVEQSTAASHALARETDSLMKLTARFLVSHFGELEQADTGSAMQLDRARAAASAA